MKESGDPAKVRDEYEKVKKYWHSRIEGLTAETPDAEFNSMFNMWNPYNNLMTFAWSRAASLILQRRAGRVRLPRYCPGYAWHYSFNSG